MQNQRHVGGQPTSQSIKMTQCSGKISVKRVQPEDNNSNEIIGEQQNCNVTSQKNATYSLVGLNDELRQSGNPNMHEEQSNDYLEVYFYSQ